MTLALDTPAMTAEISAERRMFVRVRETTARHLAAFLRAPAGWAMLVALLAATAWYADVREGNRQACAATAMTLDTRTFGEVINGTGGAPGGAQIQRACAGMPVPGPNWAQMR